MQSKAWSKVQSCNVYHVIIPWVDVTCHRPTFLTPTEHWNEAYAEIWRRLLLGYRGVYSNTRYLPTQSYWITRLPSSFPVLKIILYSRRRHEWVQLAPIRSVVIFINSLYWSSVFFNDRMAPSAIWNPCIHIGVYGLYFKRLPTNLPWCMLPT